MTNATAQTRKKPTEKMLRFRVDYYNDSGIRLFRWAGKAISEAGAESQGLAAYNSALQALCQAQGLPASCKIAEVIVAASDPVPTASPDCWRLGWLPPNQVERHPGAVLDKLPVDIIEKLATSAALSDAVALQAMTNQEPMAVGFWVAATEKGDMRDVGTCLLISRNGRQVQHRWTEPALSDALRLVTLRTSLPFRPRGRGDRLPFSGPRVNVVTPGSATIRAMLVSRPPAPPQHLIEWLEAEGYSATADRLRLQFNAKPRAA